MRTVLKFALWGLILFACAGAGAFVAAHSNPFQPEVEGTNPSVSPTPIVVAETWTARMKSRSWHQFVVGGRCTSRWSGSLSVMVSEEGLVTGGGRAHLVGRLRCGFPNAQIQSKTLRLSVLGTRQPGTLAVEVREAGGLPAGGHDYGGFLNTVLKEKLALPARNVARTFHLKRNDATGRGHFESITVFTLACTFGCPGG